MPTLKSALLWVTEVQLIWLGRQLNSVVSQRSFKGQGGQPVLQFICMGLQGRLANVMINALLTHIAAAVRRHFGA